MKNLFDPLWLQWEEDEDVYESTIDYTIEYDYDSNLVLESLIKGGNLSSEELMIIEMQLQGFSIDAISNELGWDIRCRLENMYSRMKDYFSLSCIK